MHRTDWRTLLRTMFTLFLVILLFSAGSSIRTGARAPLQTSSATSAMLDYLAGLEGNAILSGQEGMFGAQTSTKTANQQLEAIFSASGLYPAITGSDFNTPDKLPAQRIPEVRDWLLAKWRDGYLVTASWHAPNPCSADNNTYNWDDVENPFNVKVALAGGSCRTQYLANLEPIIQALLALKAQGVILLWRPYHEMNGPWFWWGGGSVPSYVALWRDMYDLFAARGLDNLLWVYSPNTPWDKWAPRADAYYPGDGYVDVVSLDEYMGRDEQTLVLGWGTSADTIEAQSGYLQLAKMDKPFILGEFGPIPSSGAAWNTKAYDWGQLVADLHGKYPRIVGFVAWEYVWQIARAPYVGQRAMMTNPLTITRDELPGFQADVPATPTSSPTATASEIPSLTPMPSATATPTASMTPTLTATQTPSWDERRVAALEAEVAALRAALDDLTARLAAASTALAGD